eukprot:2845502-Rhodomonas_salina.6
MSGTGIAYGGSCLCACYAMSSMGQMVHCEIKCRTKAFWHEINCKKGSFWYKLYRERVVKPLILEGGARSMMHFDDDGDLSRKIVTLFKVLDADHSGTASTRTTSSTRTAASICTTALVRDVRYPPTPYVVCCYDMRAVRCPLSRYMVSGTDIRYQAR